MTDEAIIEAVLAEREWMEDLLLRLTAAPTTLGNEEPGQVLMEQAFADCGLAPRRSAGTSAPSATSSPTGSRAGTAAAR
jgi:acetylornithine deacetylase